MDCGITWRAMTTIMALEMISCVALTVAWLIGYYVDLIENFFDIPECDFSCFTRVSNQLAVIKILCAVLYSACAVTAGAAMYGFLAGKYKPVWPHYVMSIVRFVGTVVLCFSTFNLTLGYHPVFIANVAVLVISIFLNGFSIVVTRIGYKLERNRNLMEDNTASDALVRPFSGQDSSCATFIPVAARFRRSSPSPPSPSPAEGDFFQRRSSATS